MPTILELVKDRRTDTCACMCLHRWDADKSPVGCCWELGVKSTIETILSIRLTFLPSSN